MRTRGKIAELALGYGGSVGAMMRMGALENGLDESELMPIVNSWRQTNPHIVQAWWDVDRKVHDALIKGGKHALQHGIMIERKGPFLKIKLPSGRELSYVKPKLDGSVGITFEGIIQNAGWGRQETYGAKLVENITQAVARDCLAESIIRLEKLGIPVVFHVHDEVIVEVPKNSYTASDIAEIMGTAIDWAPGLPLKADAYECPYYRKD